MIHSTNTKLIAITAKGILLVVFFILFDACKKTVDINLIDPVKDPSGFSRALQLTGSNVGGNMPTSSSCNFNIQYFQSSALTTQDASLYVPFSFTSAVPVKGIYMQVRGADNYWDIPIKNQSSNKNTYIIEVAIPRFVLNGKVPIQFIAYGENGCTTNRVTMNTEIKASEDICSGGGAYKESGAAGLTVRKLILGNTAGTVKIAYSMYSIPDRLDIKYDGAWVASTNTTLLTPSDFPPSSICYDKTPGYVSGDNILTFQYDPKKSREVLIYMNGCFGATAWDISVSCPE